jgi:hypothetical protein
MARRIQQLTVRDMAVLSDIVAIYRGDRGERARRYLMEFIATWKRAEKLRGKGLQVEQPAPKIGRPQFLLIRK